MLKSIFFIIEKVLNYLFLQGQAMGATIGRKVQRENLRKHVLYEGDYRVLNFALIAIITLIIAGIYEGVLVSDWLSGVM